MIVKVVYPLVNTVGVYIQFITKACLLERSPFLLWTIHLAVSFPNQLLIQGTSFPTGDLTWTAGV